MNNPTSDHMHSLDGLRGIAALIVVFCHYANAFYPAINGLVASGGLTSRIAGTPLYLFFAGDFAVCIFFVLSGFVLSKSFFQTGSSSVLTSGAIRRYARLMPPVLGITIISWLLLRSGAYHNQETATITGSSLWLGQQWADATTSLLHAGYQGLIGTFFAGNSAYDSSLWTMQFELYGSFLIFISLALIGKLRNRWVFYLGMALYFFNTYYLAFVLGIVLCDVWNIWGEKILKQGSKLWPILLVAVFGGSWYVIPGVFNIYSYIHVRGIDNHTLTRKFPALDKKIQNYS